MPDFSKNAPVGGNLRIGVGGYPPAFYSTPYGKDRMKIFEWLHSMGLDAFEAMMTYGPRTTVETAGLMRKFSREFDIRVSVHAAYYIVLTSSEKDKVGRSTDMLLKTFELADKIGSDTVVLHPGSLYKRPSSETADILADNINEFFGRLGKTGIGLFIETAGKKAQFGSLEEILEVSSRIKGCHPCIDFGHLHARSNGGLATDCAIDKVFDQLSSHGAFKKGRRIHFHYTPIHYGEKGEIQHRKIDDIYNAEDAGVSRNPRQCGSPYLPRYQRIVENLLRFGANATIISETHNSQDKGALAMLSHSKYLKGL